MKFIWYFEKLVTEGMIEVLLKFHMFNFLMPQFYCSSISVDNLTNFFPMLRRSIECFTSKAKTINSII